MSSINTSSVLPIDIINKILSMSSVQQDKMYSPSFSSKSGRLNWRFNPLNSKIQKIASLYASPEKRVKFEAVKIRDVVYECKTVMFENVEGNYVEYISVISHIPPNKHIYIHLKYTRLDEAGFNMFFTGVIYEINRLGNGESVNEMMIKNIISLLSLTGDGLKCVDVPAPYTGSWYYNPQLHLMEFVVNYGELWESDTDQEDDIMTETETETEQVEHPIHYAPFAWEDIQQLDMYM